MPKVSRGGGEVAAASGNQFQVPVGPGAVH